MHSFPTRRSSDLVSINQIDDFSKLADTVASHLALKIPEKQELLESETVSDRLEKVYAFMDGEIGVLQVEKRIRNRGKRQNVQKIGRESGEERGGQEWRLTGGQVTHKKIKKK